MPSKGQNFAALDHVCTCVYKRHIFEDIVNSLQKVFYERFLKVTDFFPNLRVRDDFLDRQSIIEFDNYLLTRRRFSLFG